MAAMVAEGGGTRLLLWLSLSREREVREREIVAAWRERRRARVFAILSDVAQMTLTTN